MKNRRLRKNVGFTLIEILAVSLLAVGLATAAAVGINSRINSSKINTAKTQIGSISAAITQFELECGFYPTTLNDLVDNSGGRRCKGFPKEGYLQSKDLLDPYRREFNYQKPGTHNQSSYDLWSSGKDEQDGTDDDIGNWEDDSDTEE